MRKEWDLLGDYFLVFDDEQGREMGAVSRGRNRNASWLPENSLLSIISECEVATETWQLYKNNRVSLQNYLQSRHPGTLNRQEIYLILALGLQYQSSHEEDGGEQGPPFSWESIEVSVMVTKIFFLLFNLEVDFFFPPWVVKPEKSEFSVLWWK